MGIIELTTNIEEGKYITPSPVYPSLPADQKNKELCDEYRKALKLADREYDKQERKNKKQLRKDIELCIHYTLYTLSKEQVKSMVDDCLYTAAASPLGYYPAIVNYLMQYFRFLKKVVKLA